MKWKMEDGGLVGPIDFGTDPSRLREIFGDAPDVFKRTPDSYEVVYAFDNAGVHLSIDGDGKLSQLTIFPENEVLIGTIQVLGKSIDKIYFELSEAGIVIEREDAGLWCKEQKAFLVEIEGLVDGVELYRDQLSSEG